MIAAILTGFAQVLLAAGRPRELFWFNVALLAVYAGAVFATVGQGIVAVAIAVVGVYVVQLIAVYAILFRKVVGIRSAAWSATWPRRSSAAWRCWRSVSRPAPSYGRRGCRRS